MKLRFDNAELEVTEDVAKAIEAERSAHAEALKASDTKAEQNAARADAAEAEVNKLREEVVFVFARVREEIKARFALETEAAKVLPSSKFDGLSDVEVKRQVAEKVLGVKLDGKSDVYVEASFDLALKQASTAPAAGLEQTAPLPRADSIDDARRKYIEALAKASA